ncbi:MAG TPA: hypothetical protein VJ746_05210 [Nitrospira sp.]|nr:hypothetical protein [Nitrospira sp.]
MNKRLRLAASMIGPVSLCWGLMTMPVVLSQTPPRVQVPQREQISAPERTPLEDPSLAERPVRYEQVIVKPSEGYFAGFGGYTFGGKFDSDNSATFNGATFGNRNLADSAVVGAKAGGFFPEQLSWLGVEAEVFRTTPHVEQEGSAPGSHVSVTTLAINAIARAQLACERKLERAEQVTERFTIQYEREFCRLQPYAGVGVGIFWLDASNSNFSAHANFVPGLNVLGGVRYYMTGRVSMFTEYKYNRATFNFVGPAGLAGFGGVYSINHLVGGFSYHY